MATNQEDLLIQKISLIRDGKAEALDRSFVRELTYIETSDLSGPRMILVMDDYYRIIRDELGIKEREVLEVVFSDRFQRDGIDTAVRFVILTMPIDDRFITFNCMELGVYMLKMRAQSTQILTQMSVSAALRKLAPGIKYDVGAFPVLNDWHLLAGMRPSKLIRQMEQEYGAVCFWQRGKLVFRQLKQLFSADPAVTYHHNDPSQPNKVLVYSKPNTGAVIQDQVERNYLGWDMVQGVVRGAKYPKAPPEFTSVVKNLDNLVEIPKPVIDFTTAGNGGLFPGLAMGLVWNTERPDLPIDESLPAKVVIGTVAHSWKPQAYFCRVSGIKP